VDDREFGREDGASRLLPVHDEERNGEVSMDVLMPQLGETVAEGKISKWFVSAGATVQPGDNLFEIETDKVSMEVPAITAGTLAAINVAAGEVAPVGAVVAVILAPGEKAAPPPPLIPAKAGIERSKALDPRLRGDERNATPRAAVAMEPFREVRSPERNYGPARLPGGTVVTPLARRLAGEAGIDLASINGSGPHGRIVARDVESARSAKPAGRALTRDTSAEQIKALYRDVPYEEVPLDGMRATIAARLTQAVVTIPHFYLTMDVAVGRLMALHAEANAATPKRDGTPAFRLSLNDLIIKAWAAALQRVPAANAVWAGDRILRFKHSDIGVAVALEGGLITPVIRQAERKTPTAISNEMRDLAERARTKKLKPDEYQGGASAISNLGMHGVAAFSAIINPPHATILAVGAARRAPTEGPDGAVSFVDMMTVTLSCDHRVVDGALGAELLAAFKGFVEQPVTMIV
jgi:pyruvate dehydrogenase E2 component (dihydrolipoamide acetyltransferase)